MGVAARARSLPRVRSLVFALVLLGTLLGGAARAAAQFDLEDAYPRTPPLGPERAQGAVIWNHGKPPLRGADGDMLPFYLDHLRDAGWDIFRLDREWSSDNLEESSAALRDKVAEIDRRGYRKVVLAGQSYGAWIALMVAASGPPIHAVIATAPAAFGRFPESDVYQRNAEDLYPILDAIRNTRVMLFLFKGDAYDPGDRATPAQAILEAHGVDHAVIGYPPGWIGHGAANWNGFATRFGPCITLFVDPARAAADADCSRNPVTYTALQLQLPQLPRQSPDPAVAGPLAGTWYGVYPNGREALLRLDGVVPTGVSAVYGWGELQRDEADAPGYERRIGHPEGDHLLFTAPDGPTLDVQPLPSGRIALTWIPVDGGQSITAELHRLP